MIQSRRRLNSVNRTRLAFLPKKPDMSCGRWQSLPIPTVHLQGCCPDTKLCTIGGQAQQYLLAIFKGIAHLMPGPQRADEVGACPPSCPSGQSTKMAFRASAKRKTEELGSEQSAAPDLRALPGRTSIVTAPPSPPTPLKACVSSSRTGTNRGLGPVGSGSPWAKRCRLRKKTSK